MGIFAVMYSLVLSLSKLLRIEDGVSKRVGEVYDEDDDKAGAPLQRQSASPKIEGV